MDPVGGCFGASAKSEKGGEGCRYGCCVHG
jgi:hypothetical protein